MGPYELRVSLDENSEACNDLIILRILDQPENRLKWGGLFIPEVASVNTELLLAEVVSVGPAAVKENISPGDRVLYDKWSAYYFPPETPGTYAITHVENVIGLYEDEA